MRASAKENALQSTAAALMKNMYYYCFPATAKPQLKKEAFKDTALLSQNEISQSHYKYIIEF